MTTTDKGIIGLLEKKKICEIFKNIYTLTAVNVAWDETRNSKATASTTSSLLSKQRKLIRPPKMKRKRMSLRWT